jgi:hypothetical protein
LRTAWTLHLYSPLDQEWLDMTENYLNPGSATQELYKIKLVTLL